MANWTTSLVRIETIAQDTAAFHFSKPEGFTFTPGQTVSLTLPADGTEAPAQKHTFSLVSAPHEETLCIATRLRQGSAYKQALAKLPVKSRLALAGPHGRFGLPATTGRPLVLIAGGIGITPYISMLREATYQGSPQHFLLLYSNRRVEDAAFLEELRALAKQNPYFRFQPTLTAAHGDTWTGLRGHIDAAMLRQALQGLSEPLCYLTGTPAMVDDLRDVLDDLGLDEADVRSEGFHGY